MANLTVVHENPASNKDEYTSAESDCDVDSLMHLLDDKCSPDPLQTYTARESLQTLIKLTFFELNENGHVNYRDATVLGKHTELFVPRSMLDAERLLFSVYLDYNVEVSQASLVDRPVLQKQLKGTNSELRKKFPIGEHQLWISPKELIGRDGQEDGSIMCKKRNWKLSRGYRSVVNASISSRDNYVKWPKFVVVVTAFRANNNGVVAAESFKSPPFEVRSKEQSNRTRAARGLTEPVRRRRTPQTEARASELRALQAEIISMRDEIENEKKAFAEYKTCCNFVAAVTRDSAEAKIIHNIANQ